MYRLVFLSIIVSGTLGQVIKQGVCDYAAIGGFVNDVNITRMLGTWHQVARIENVVETGACSSITIDGQYNVNGSLIDVQVSFLEVVNKTKTTHNGTIQYYPEVAGLFFLNLTGFLEAEFVVQATNYTDYAIFYACHTLTKADSTQDTNDTKVVAAWQYHRKSNLLGSELNSLLDIANVNPDLNNTEWRYISHNDSACGNAGVSLAVPHALIVLVTLFLSKICF